MILISGEALVDLIPDRVRENAYDAILGGSPYNVAIGLARLGRPTAFVSRLSKDANGESFVAALVKAGVDLSFVELVDEPATLAFVMRGTAETGARYSFYLDGTSYDGLWPFPQQWPPEARHLHVGSIAALDARHGESVVAALVLARPHASASFDPNIRPLVMPDRERVIRLVEREAGLAAIVKASEEDLRWLYPERDPEAAVADWARRGPRFCVVTRGPDGAVAFLGKQRLEARAPKIDVVDTVGAGDSFMSALIGAMDADGALGRRGEAPDAASLEKWLSFAVAASAITCTRRGSDPPTRAEVEAMLSG